MSSTVPISHEDHTMSDRQIDDVSRRDFLKAGAVAAAAVCTGTLALGTAVAADDPYRGFKMGIQSYTLRGFKVQEALEISKKLGLHYWEAYPEHIKVGAVPNYIAEQKALLAGADVKLVAFGVVPFSDNEAKAREYFDFAKAIGIESLSADPQKNEATFKLLDKLVEEYGDQYRHPQSRAQCQLRQDRRRREMDERPSSADRRLRRYGALSAQQREPGRALERLKERVFGVHLKDVKDAKVFKILGEGDLDVLGCLKVLQKIKYKYCLALEYEENAKNPVPDIEICLQNVQKAMAKLS